MPWYVWLSVKFAVTVSLLTAVVGIILKLTVAGEMQVPYWCLALWTMDAFIVGEMVGELRQISKERS